MFEIGEEVIFPMGSVLFRGFVRTAPFVWQGKRHIVVTNGDQVFIPAESTCRNARPVLVEE